MAVKNRRSGRRRSISQERIHTRATMPFLSERRKAFSSRQTVPHARRANKRILNRCGIESCPLFQTCATMAHMKRFFAVVLTSLATFTLAPVASADVVSPQPASCPEGGQPATCHGGPHCRLLVCATDSDCLEGRVCQDRSFCVGTINCAGLLPPDSDPTMYDVQTLENTCAAGDSCDAGAMCKAVKVCVSPNDAHGFGIPSSQTAVGCVRPSTRQQKSLLTPCSRRSEPDRACLSLRTPLDGVTGSDVA